MKNPEIISAKGMTKHFELSNILGKKVIAENGEVVGKVKDIAFDMNRIIGLYVAGAIGKVIIGREYIEQFHADSVVLKINPVTALKGKIVFDKDGKRLGRVTEIKRKGTTNEFTELAVKKNAISKSIQVPKKYMDVISKNIILKKVIKE